MQPPTYILNNRYSIVRTIGKGGMGAVFEAIDTRLGNHVAVKQTLVAAAQTNAAFEHEARLLARLHHPALPVVSDFFAESGAQFLVMQYIPGDDLAMLLLQRGQPFPVADVLRWADALLDALEYLHAQQPPVIHRDIKPHNLKFNDRGDIVLLDFGIAKGGNATTQLGQSVRAYTLHYAPLEQIQQQGTTARSDLYALGATLYQLLTGTLPPSALERAAAKLSNLPDPLQAAHEIDSSITPAVGLVLSQALALNADDRYQSAGEMRRALRMATLQNPPIGAPPARVAARVAPPPAPTTMSTGATITLGSPRPARKSILNRAASISVAVKSLGSGLMSRVAGQRISRAQRSPRAVAALQSTLSPPRLWRHWTFANMVWVWLFMPLAFVLGPGSIVLIGAVAGIGQWLVLRDTKWRTATRHWLAATSVAGPIAFVTGFLVDYTLDLTPIVSWLLSGAAAGAVLGLTQWWALRRVAPITAAWIAGQSIGWAIVVFLCGISIGFVFVAGLISGAIGGAVLYAIARLESRLTVSGVPSTP